jgi:hypothetical protein
LQIDGIVENTILGDFVRIIFVDSHLDEQTTAGLFFIRNVETFTTKMLDLSFVS